MRRSPRDTALSARKITRRSLVLAGAQLAFMGVLGARMRYMQVEEADAFRLLADENRINDQVIAPARGRIYDRNGLTIADNVPSYRIVMVRENVPDVEQTLDELSQIVPLSDEDRAQAIRALRGSPRAPVTVLDRVSWDDLSRVAVNGPALPGVSPEVGLSRIYPLGSEFAHVVGYVGRVSQSDLDRYEDPPPLLRIPRFQIGKVGVESKEEERLRGKPGVKRVEVNNTGRVMRELDRTEGKPGADLQLTVDHALQSYVQARLGEESASAVVIDCETGDLLAIASSPSYDPNKFVEGISVADYSVLRDNEYRPLASKTVQDTYPPGSTFKMVTLLAALDAGIIGANDTFRCNGFLEVASRRFHCWKGSGHGNVDLEASLRESCDVYYYELALKTGIERITAMARRLGLGEKHGVPMSAESSGVAPTREWKRNRFGKDWVIGDSVNASIGQGFVASTPLQLAVMTARIATGRAVSPRLVKTVDGIEQPTGAGAPLDLNENHLRLVRRAMFTVSNSRRGTAYGSRIIADGLRMAGKTGTSQVRNLQSERERFGRVLKDDEVEWRRRDHALFVNFAPADKPKIAVSVIVEHGGGGSKTAAPIARDITLQALYGEDPPLDAYPAKDRDRIRAQQATLRRLRREQEQNGGGSQA